jgi:hypothetical protein
MGQTCDLMFRADPGATITTTDLFTALKFPGPGKVCTLSIALDTSVKVYVRAGLVGATQTNMVLNSDVALVANALYTFSFIVDPNLTYTLRASAAALVLQLSGVLSME